MWAAGQCSRNKRSTGVVSKISPSELRRITRIRANPWTSATSLCWCIGQYPFIDLYGIINHPFHRERLLHPLAPGSPKGFTVLGVREEIAHSVCQRLGIA